MGQAKNRGTYEERVAQAQALEAARVRVLPGRLARMRQEPEKVDYTQQPTPLDLDAGHQTVDLETIQLLANTPGL